MAISMALAGGLIDTTGHINSTPFSPSAPTVPSPDSTLPSSPSAASFSFPSRASLKSGSPFPCKKYVPYARQALPPSERELRSRCGSFASHHFSASVDDSYGTGSDAGTTSNVSLLGATTRRSIQPAERDPSRPTEVYLSDEESSARLQEQMKWRKSGTMHRSASLSPIIVDIHPGDTGGGQIYALRCRGCGSKISKSASEYQAFQDEIMTKHGEIITNIRDFRMLGWQNWRNRVGPKRFSFGNVAARSEDDFPVHFPLGRCFDQALDNSFVELDVGLSGHSRESPDAESSTGSNPSLDSGASPK